ncbi:MAG: hypothetical protein ABII13_03150 [Patescibacteria group bacterium]
MHDQDGITTRQIQRLLERAHAKKDPLTRKQLDRLLTDPNSPILPYQCVDAKKLPKDWGAGDQAIWDLALGPDQKPCYATKLDGVMNVVVGGGSATISLGKDSETKADIEIVGFSEDGRPYLLVTKLQERMTVDDSLEFTVVNQKFYCGSVNLLNFRPAETITAFTVLKNKLPLIAMWDSHKLRENLYLFQELLGGPCHLYSKLFTSSSGVVHCLVGSNKIIEYHPQSGEFMMLPVSCSGRRGHKYCDIAEINEGVCFIVGERDGDTLVHVYDNNSHSLKPAESVPRGYPTINYSSNFSELGDGRFAFIGDVSPNVDTRRTCWVVDGVPQPSFEHVTPLFRKDDQWLYYAVNGRFLYTMELPDAGQE